MSDILGAGGGGADAGAAGLGDIVKEGTAEGFLDDVLEASKSRPVICDFGAPRSEDSRTLSYDLEQLVVAAKGAVALVRFNVETVPQIAQQLRIQAVPTIYAFVDGQPTDGFQGGATEEQLSSFVARLTGDVQPAEAAALVEEGLQALETGDGEAAMAAFGAALQSDRFNVDALAGLGKAFLAAGDPEQAERLLGEVPEEHEEHPAVRSLKAAIQLAEQTGDAGDSTEAAEFLRKLEADANDLQTRFDLALLYIGANQSEQGIDELLEIMRRKSGWNDDAARKQLLDLFQALGPTHPATVEGRRKLSIVLFS